MRTVKIGVIMFLQYKGHSIGTIPWRLADGNKWRAKVIVQWNEGLSVKTQQFISPLSAFGSEEKADLWAIATGRKWIDDGKPAIALDQIQDQAPN